MLLSFSIETFLTNYDVISHAYLYKDLFLVIQNEPCKITNEIKDSKIIYILLIFCLTITVIYETWGFPVVKLGSTWLPVMVYKSV